MKRMITASEVSHRSGTKAYWAKAFCWKQWQRWHEQCSTAGKQQLEKFVHRWLKGGCVWQGVMNRVKTIGLVMKDGWW